MSILRMACVPQHHVRLNLEDAVEVVGLSFNAPSQAPNLDLEVERNT